MATVTCDALAACEPAEPEELALALPELPEPPDDAQPASANANTAANALLDGVLAGLGNRAIRPDRPGRARVVNPYPFPVAMPAAVPLLGWEYPDGCRQQDRPLALRDAESVLLLPTQTGPGPRGRLAEAVLSLNPGESRELRLEYAPAGREMAGHTPGMCADAITDQAGLEEFKSSAVDITRDVEEYFRYTKGHVLLDWFLLILFVFGFLLLARIVLQSISKEKEGCSGTSVPLIATTV